MTAVSLVVMLGLRALFFGITGVAFYLVGLAARVVSPRRAMT